MSLTTLTTHKRFTHFYCGAPIYYYSKQKQKEFIILCPYHSDNDGLLQYDIEQNKWISFAPFPDDFRPQYSYFTIDPQNELIYVFSGQHDKVFGIYSLINNKWNNIKKCNMNHTDGTCCFIPENMNQLHVFGSADQHLPHDDISFNHLIYNDISKTFRIASKNGIDNNCLNFVDPQGMIYIPVRKILIIAGGYADMDGNDFYDNIWYTDITQKPKSNYEWKVLGKLPTEGWIRCVVAFGAVLIISDCKHQMWCADMALNSIEWRKCPLKLPIVKDEDDKDLYLVIASQSQFVHFIMCDKYHFKMHLSQFLPEDIYAKYASNDDEEHKCNECDLWKTKYESVERERKELQSENLKLRKENMTLNEECKEIHIQLDDVTKEMKKRKGFKIGASRFMEWSYDDVVDWIISLDSGRFGEKEESLRKMFIEEEINGAVLPRVDQTDIKEWGFTKFNDKKDLLKYIKTLVLQNTANIDMNKNEGKNITAYI